MEEIHKMKKLAGHLKEYAETRFELVVLNAQEKASGIVSSAVSAIIGIVLGLFVVLFASIGASLWLGNYFQSTYMGFFLVALFYLLIVIILILNREKWIKTPVINAMIKKMNHHEED